ncbi:ISAs1 family transposase, partial [uncultured Ruminococcus sp.]|uniref:ISAs1 family transposase n=1 Tax=uncultured Ruminococcus sp. TaxID=165186 RepID=UPI00262DB922
ISVVLKSGRISSLRIKVYLTSIVWIVSSFIIHHQNGREKWTDLNRIGMIVAKTEENGRKTEQRHYFIYSCKNMTAQQIMRAKRAHWSIENSLHWVLDIAFREDESRARKGDSAENFNILRQIVVNILKLDTSFKESIPNKQFRCLLDSAYLDHLVNLWVCS